MNAPSAAAPKRPRILVVEDEIIISMAIEQALNALDFEVAGTARTGEHAIELAAEIRPDLVLMDIRLAGEMDGIEAAGRIRAQCQLPVVFLTSHGDSAILARAKLTEPSGYILKPFEDRDIHIALEMALYKHRAEAQLRKLQKLESFGQLAGGIAHNFNNLLTVIQGYAGMIRDENATQPGTLAAVEQLQAATDRAATLTRQLLTFSQRQVMERRPIGLDRVVNGTLEILRRTLPPGIAVEFHSTDGLCVDADEGMLEQLIVSLADNARDAMPGGGRFVIQTRRVAFAAAEVEGRREARAGDFARLTVIDAGCGMNPETLERIFEPFFTTKDIGAGTGLGLSTVHGIVKQHRGWIEVKSEPGKGSTFEIFLPLSTAEPSAAKAAAVSPSHRGQETILLVEDEIALRRMLRLMLEHAGYRILEAESGRAAMEMWEECARSVSLVITDVQMPGGVSGRQLADWLIAQKPELKIILSSGFIAGAADRDIAAQMGGAFLQKPYPRRVLLQTVRDCLDR